MPRKEFWHPRLCGARFEDGTIPLQVLSDLTALREMVIDVAEWCYLSENPSRQRVSRGIADKIDLKLAGDGSVVPIIDITTTELTLLDLEFSHRKFLDQTKEDYIATAIATAL